jgi:hypothetical protein
VVGYGEQGKVNKFGRIRWIPPEFWPSAGFLNTGARGKGVDRWVTPLHMDVLDVCAAVLVDI